MGNRKYNFLTTRYREDTYEDEEAYDRILVARSRLIRDYPFWGILGLKLILVEEPTGEVQTMATDSMHVFYNSDFVKSLPYGGLMFGYAHELYHCMSNHVGERSRKHGRDDRLWNIAGDYVVNLDLLDQGIGSVPPKEVIEIYLNEDFRDMSAEQIYEIIKDDPKMIPPNANLMDLHIDVSSGGPDQDGSQNGENPHVVIDEETLGKMKQDWERSVQQAVIMQVEKNQINGNRAGSGIPPSVQRMINELLVPRVSWKQMLKNFTNRMMLRSYSFSAPNRKNQNRRVILPGYRKPDRKLELHLAFDTSGSVDQEQFTTFVSEFNGILKSFQNYHITAWCFGSEVIEDSVIQISKNGDRSIGDLKKFLDRASDGGGTDFTCNWEWMKRNRIKPRGFLMFTDGEPLGSWGDPSYCPTMFLIVGNTERIKAPFGITAHYEDQ